MVRDIYIIKVVFIKTKVIFTKSDKDFKVALFVSARQILFVGAPLSEVCFLLAATPIATDITSIGC